MAKIRIDIDGILMDGHEVTFKAPCDCTEVDGIKVYYIKSGEQKSKNFTMKDTHGNALAGLGDLFMSGAYVKAVLDTTNRVAYIQNSDTNGYLEGRLDVLDVALEKQSGELDLINAKITDLFFYHTTETTLTLATGHNSVTPPTFDAGDGYTVVCIGIQTNTTGDVSVNAWAPSGTCRVYNRTGAEKEVTLTFHWLAYKNL